jgi:hypothetical protein
MPSDAPTSLEPADVDPWQEEWYAYKRAVVSRVMKVLERHEHPEALAEALTRLCRVVPGARNSGKVLYEGSDDSYGNRGRMVFRNPATGQRYGICRKTPTVWWYERYEISGDYETDTDVHRALAQAIVRASFGWGDLKDVGMWSMFR